MNTAFPNQTPLKYRPDIDGLRALAVLSVVFFHAFPEFLTSGFIGVDIFFIISGFLITKIILSNLQNKNFSMLEFYARRIRRIFPSLILIITTLLIFGWFYLLSEEYAQLGKHTLGGVFFVSNMILKNEVGYFDLAAEGKPLLHLWSLSIEEQFYILYPLTLFIIFSRFKKYLIHIILLLLLISLIFCIYYSFTNHIFYSPFARVWELLLGALIAIGGVNLSEKYANTNFNNYSALIGLLLIILSLILIDKSKIYPSYWTLMPALGTALIILAGPDSLLNKVIFSNKLIVFIGLISYPLYLWHWPVFFVGKLFNGGIITINYTLLLILISIILAFLTYIFVESPIRHNNNRKVVSFLILAMSIIGASGVYIYSHEGCSFRANMLKYDSYYNTSKRIENCKNCIDIPYAYAKSDDWLYSLGDRSAERKIFAFGDSHAYSLLPALEIYARENQTNILFSSVSGCPPLLGIQSMRGPELIKTHNCKLLNERIYKYVKDNKINEIILIGRWSYYTDSNNPNYLTQEENESLTIENSRDAFKNGLIKTVDAYAKIGVKIYLVEDSPRQKYTPKEAMRLSILTDDAINKNSVTTNENSLYQSYPNKLFDTFDSKNLVRISFAPLLCNNENCPLLVDGKFLYYDDNHLSIEGAKHIYPMLESALSNVHY